MRHLFRRLAIISIVGILVAACGPDTPTDDEPEPSPTVVLELPEAPMDLELTSGVSGYASVGDGRVISFSGSEDGFEWKELATGLTFARGIAVDATTLYVVDLGDLPCEPVYPSCPKVTPADEIEILKASRGRVLAYPLVGDGLGEPRVLVDELPVIGRDHAPNDIEIGPDGMLYLVIGNVDFSWEHLELLEHPHLDWLGTVLRIDPQSGETAVFARGLRNIYGLTWTDDDRLIGVDNDGPTHSGWREEELTEIVEGGEYGYPEEGSLGPFEVRRDFPIYYLSTSGTAAVAAYEDGVLIGSCGLVQYAPSLARSGYQIFEVRHVATVDGCVTSIVVTESELLVSIFGTPGHVLSIPRPSDA